MHFKLIVVFIEDSRTEDVTRAARDAGAGGATIIEGEYHEVDETGEPRSPTDKPWKHG